MTVQGEAQGIETFSVELCGVSVSVPADIDNAPVALLEAFENNRVTQIVEALVPAGQLVKIKRSATVGDYKRFVESVAEQMGFGNSGE